MKRNLTLTLACFLFTIFSAAAQESGTFTVGGDLDKYYPVTFLDGARFTLRATELEIGREIHTDGSWRGSLISKFSYHLSGWGGGSQFVDANIKQLTTNNIVTPTFIGGWRDASAGGNLTRLIIWLRGNTTYYYHSNSSVTPLIYDGVQNALPLQEPGGPAHSYKTAVDSYVNQQGVTLSKTMNLYASGTNFINGNLGIGTYNTGPYKLAVEGTIGARKVKVTSAAPWADFVFEKDYELPTLKELEDFVSMNKHLPGIPTAAEVEQNGVELGDISAKLLQKIEEQTLYIIELNKKREEQTSQLSELNKKLEALTKRLEQLEK